MTSSLAGVNAGAVASTSAAPPQQGAAAGPAPKNPQLGPEPFFAYPTPTDEQVEEELPPYFEGENVQLGLLLDRLVGKGYGDLRHLVGDVLPTHNARDKPKHIISYAKTTRHALLKYLAVLRWKTSVDIPSHSSAASSLSAPHATQPNGPASFPTPHSNGDSNDTSPGAFSAKDKGKGKAVPSEETRGKVTDAKRIAHFMAHQNKQHDDAVEHVRHVTKVVEGLRERNPDLLTALALLTEGTYPRLPSSLIQSFLPKPPLTNASILSILRRLNRQLRYRLRCVDYVPSELTLEEISSGRVYVKGGGEHGWNAEMTLVGFAEDSRWWLTGVDWGWMEKEKGVDDPGGDDHTSGEARTKRKKKFEGEERQQILDLANMEVLAPKNIPPEPPATAGKDEQPAKSAMETPLAGSSTGKFVEGDAATNTDRALVDAPLVRLYNFIQHLSLSYQLEVLLSQAVALSLGKWRGHIIAEMDRKAKVLRVKYWIRPRPAPVQQQQQAAVGKRPPLAGSAGAARTPLLGGTLSISLAESAAPVNDTDAMLGEISSGGLIPNERVLRLELGVKWEIGEAGVGGGLKMGDVPDGGLLRIDPSALNLEDLLLAATRAHAAHLTRAQSAAVLSSPRIILSQQPSLDESTDPTSLNPLTLQIPLPSKQRVSYLAISVSARNGLMEIVDLGAAAGEARAGRVKMAMGSVNEGRTRLVDDIGRLTIAIITENMEDQMRQLGWRPTRRLALRSQDLAKADLHPATTIFVPLPSAPPSASSQPMQYFVAKVTPQGIAFELLKLSRVMMDHGLGARFVIGERVPMDLALLKSRRKNGMVQGGSPYEVDNKDLKDLFIYTNALVAQSIVEQQLSSRSIPYTTQLPPVTGPGAPRSTSPLAGLVPTICVNVADLLRDGRSAGAAVEVAMPRVCLQIEGWWKGGLCEVVTIVQLRHQPPQQSTEQRHDPIDSARANDITFDPSTSVVKFRARDISRCVPEFLEQWERLSKVVIVAGEVSQLNKHSQFRDVQMLSFDLRTATLRYAKGYNASITYTPTDDSYQVTFSCDSSTSPSQSPNPHTPLASLLSSKLNELCIQPGGERKKGAIGREFVGLLRGTLPFLLAAEKLDGRLPSEGDSPGRLLTDGKEGKEVTKEEGKGWTLVVLGVQLFRLVKDHKGRRYAIDIDLLPDLHHYLVRDASSPRGPDHLVDIYTGELSELRMDKAITKVYELAREASRDSKDQERSTQLGGKIPPLVRLDGGKTLLVDIGRVGVVSALVEELQRGLEA